MNNTYKLKHILNQQDCYLEDEFYEIYNDTYHLEDKRVWTSNIEDIYGGDNFADFCVDYFKLLEENEYFED